MAQGCRQGMQGALPVKPERQRPLYQRHGASLPGAGSSSTDAGCLTSKATGNSSTVSGRDTWDHVGRWLVLAVAFVGLLLACRTGRSPDHHRPPGLAPSSTP